MFASLLPIIRFPSSLLKTPINDRSIALIEILATMLGLAPEHNDINIAYFFFWFIRLTIAAIHRQGKIHDRGPARSIPKLWISREVPDQNNFIESHHRRNPLPRVAQIVQLVPSQPGSNEQS